MGLGRLQEGMLNFIFGHVPKIARFCLSLSYYKMHLGIMRHVGDFISCDSFRYKSCIIRSERLESPRTLGR